jgi:hypothetical protein
MQFSLVALRVAFTLRRGQIVGNRKGIQAAPALTEITVASTQIKLRLQLQT